jgi:alkaline phosphatase
MYLCFMKTKTTALFALFLFFILGLVACQSGPQKEAKKEKEKPKKIIFLIGDGMGLSQISSLYFMQEKDATNFNRFPSIGLINTSSSSHKITDSAAGATAFTCGKKTFNGSIGMDKDSNAVESITERFNDYTFGLVATSSITHATPAAFYSHNVSRHATMEIAKDLVESNISYFAAGGKAFLRPLWSDLKAAGFALDSNVLGSKTGKKQGYVLANDGMPMMTEGRGDFLPNATQNALEFLEQQGEYFFLMVEGSQIDWGGHAEDAAYIFEEMKDFDKTLGVVLDYAKGRDDVLIVVTADHETGGFSLASKENIGPEGKPKKDYDTIEPLFTTGGHTATLVPVFAYGVGASFFQGTYENTGIYDRFVELME